MTEKILLTGRAGTGKTRAVLERVLAEIRAGKSDRCLLLLPTQSQVDHLRGLLLREGPTAFRDDFLHTFFTLARSLARDLPGQLLTPSGRDTLIGDLLRRGKLPAFEGVRGFPGFWQVLGGAIKELKENGIRAEDYGTRILGRLGGERGAAARHRDLGRAYREYEQRLRARRKLDQEDLAGKALERLEAEPSLLGDRDLLLVDGFHDFTPVQFRILRLLSERIRVSICTLSQDTGDPAHPIFEVSEPTRRALVDLGFREKALRGNHRTEDPTLRALEAGLFAPAPPRAEAGGSLRLLSAARREDEVEGIARSILRMVREEGVPFRDIAVLFHDLGEVAELLEGTFERFGIPLRVYQPRPLGRRPIVRFLIDLGNLLCRPPDRETFIRFLRSGYPTRLEAAEVDRLEEILRETRPPAGWREWLDLSARHRLRGVGRLLETLSGAASRLAGKHELGFLAAGWLGTFEALALPLGEDGPGGPEECAALEAFRGIVEDCRVLSEEAAAPLRLGELLESVREGLHSATFRRQDRRKEVVNAINVYQARQWEVPVLFVAGVLEKQFPPAPAEDIFFADEDRRKLQEAGLRFPDRQWRQAEERLFFYTAVTRARRRLQLSCPTSDARGNPTLKSFFLHEVEKLFTEKSLRARTARRSPAEVLPEPESSVSLEDADRTVFLGLGERFPRRTIPPSAALAVSLLDRRRTDPVFHVRLLSFLNPVRPELRLREIREEIATKEIAHSPSSLARFHQCPYLHFVEKWLRLRRLPEPEMAPADLGGVLHDALKEIFASGGREKALEILDRHLSARLAWKRPRFRPRADGWQLRKDLEDFLRTEAGRAHGPLVPRFREEPFGLGEESSPPVRLSVEGREELLSGRIDRVDTDPSARIGVVVDYKYSRADRVAKQFKSGTGDEIENLQIAVYLLAARESLGLEPAGVELVALKRGTTRYGLGRSRFRDEGLLPAEVSAPWDTMLGEEEYEALLHRARERAGSLIAAIRGGSIETRPKDLRACGPGVCGAADICRYDRWVGRLEGEG